LNQFTAAVFLHYFRCCLRQTIWLYSCKCFRKFNCQNLSLEYYAL